MVLNILEFGPVSPFWLNVCGIQLIKYANILVLYMIYDQRHEFHFWLVCYVSTDISIDVDICHFEPMVGGKLVSQQLDNAPNNNTHNYIEETDAILTETVFLSL